MAKKIINTSSIMKKFLILSIAFVFLWVGQFFIRTLSNKMSGESNTDSDVFINNAEASSCWNLPAIDLTDITYSTVYYNGNYVGCFGCYGGQSGVGSCGVGGAGAGSGAGVGSGASDGGGSIGCSVGV